LRSDCVPPDESTYPHMQNIALQTDISRAMVLVCNV
jgi:hypothetical protein